MHQDSATVVILRLVELDLTVCFSDGCLCLPVQQATPQLQVLQRHLLVPKVMPQSVPPALEDWQRWSVVHTLQMMG